MRRREKRTLIDGDKRFNKIRTPLDYVICGGGVVSALIITSFVVDYIKESYFNNKEEAVQTQHIRISSVKVGNSKETLLSEYELSMTDIAHDLSSKNFCFTGEVKYHRIRQDDSIDKIAESESSETPKGAELFKYWGCKLSENTPDAKPIISAFSPEYKGNVSGRLSSEASIFKFTFEDSIPSGEYNVECFNGQRNKSLLFGFELKEGVLSYLK